MKTLSDLWNSVRPNAGGNQQQQQPPNNQQQQQVQTDPSKTNNLIPGKSTVKPDGTGPGAFPKVGEDDASPLAEFDKLWEPLDPKTASPKSSMVPKITMDPKKIMESARTQDFTKGIAPEVLERLSKGNDPDAILIAINQASQAAYAQGTSASTGILQKALEMQAKVFEDKIMPEILRKHNIGNALRADNSLFDNPAVAPMLNLVEAQFATKYPNASPVEITQKAKLYLEGFASELLENSGKVISDKPTVTKSALAKSEPDWGKFFDVDPATLPT